MLDTLGAMLWKPIEGGGSSLILAVFAAAYVGFRIAYSIYDVYLGPLSKVILKSMLRSFETSLAE